MDAMRQYLKEIKNIPLLTPEDELRLAKRVGKGDAKAHKQMVRSNLRLVISIAKRYGHLGVPLMDLIEEGNLGLMKAVGKYNPKKGYRFSTYAAWWIRQYITRAIADQGKVIRIPVYMVEAINRWKKATSRLSQKLGRKPTLREVAKTMKLSVKKVKEIATVVDNTTSLEAPIGEGDTGQFMDLIEDVESPSAKEDFMDFLRHERVEKLLSQMNAREREILTMRFGLEDGVGHTLGDVAKRFGITRERVRQIENATMKKLKDYLLSQKEEER